MNLQQTSKVCLSKFELYWCRKVLERKNECVLDVTVYRLRCVRIKNILHKHNSSDVLDRVVIRKEPHIYK